METDYPFEYVLIFGADVSRELQEAVAGELSSNGLTVKQVDCEVRYSSLALKVAPVPPLSEPIWPIPRVQEGENDYLEVSASFEVMWQTSATLALPLTQPVESSQLEGERQGAACMLAGVAAISLSGSCAGLDDLGKKRLALSSSERVQVVETLMNAVKVCAVCDLPARLFAWGVLTCPVCAPRSLLPFPFAADRRDQVEVFRAQRRCRGRAACRAAPPRGGAH